MAVGNKAAPQSIWSSLSLMAAVKGADLALRVPKLRDLVLDRLLQRLDYAYTATEQDEAKMLHLRWLGSHLRPFLQRLIRERPAGARAIVRFIGTWVQDMYRRTDSQALGGASPCTVVIEPTDRCNLTCPGCYAKSTSEGSDVPFEHVVDIVQQVVEMGVTLITISGGEPFIREREERVLTRLGERFHDRGFLVYTNGTLIDDEIVRRLAEVGNIFPAISVEGYEHQTDARRGKGTYKLNRAVRRKLGQAGVMTGFSATVTRENVESIAKDEFIDLRIEEGDLFGWFFLLQPIGRKPRADLMVTPDQRAMLREAVYRWRQQGRPIFLGDFWNDGHLVGGCIAGGAYYFHIYANGDISPCVFSPIAVGNIFDIIAGRSKYSSLAEFVGRHPVFVGFRQAQRGVSDRNSPCMLIDHPEVFRRLAQLPDCRPAKNMPPGYIDGEIGKAIDAVARQWHDYVPSLPPLPAEVEAREAASRSAAG